MKATPAGRLMIARFAAVAAGRLLRRRAPRLLLWLLAAALGWAGVAWL